MVKPSIILFETERCYLRELTGEDAAFACALNNDPNVIKYTGNLPFESIEAAASFLKSYPDYKQFGYGRWAVVLKESNEILGWCGLKFHPESKETDLGYRFLKKHWNQGFATEASRAVIKYGFNHLNLNKIIANAHKDNLPSIRVMEKTGLHFWKNILFEGTEGVCYKIEKVSLPL